MGDVIFNKFNVFKWITEEEEDHDEAENEIDQDDEELEQFISIANNKIA